MAKKFDFKKMPVKIGGIAAGVAGGKFLKKMLPNANPLIPAGIALIGGAVLPSFMKGEMMESIGNGLIAQGASQLIDKFVPGINGVGEVDETDETTPTSTEYLMSGLNDGLGDLSDENNGLGNTQDDENNGLGNLTVTAEN